MRSRRNIRKGFYDANGKYHDTEKASAAFTGGGLPFLDEMDNLIPEMLIMLNAAIANRHFDFPTGRGCMRASIVVPSGRGAEHEYTGASSSTRRR